MNSPEYIEINRKLDLLLELRSDLRAHVENDRQMFYGTDGSNGLIAEVITLKNSNRLYNKVITLIGTVLVGLVGESVWKSFK